MPVVGCSVLQHFRKTNVGKDREKTLEKTFPNLESRAEPKRRISFIIKKLSKQLILKEYFFPKKFHLCIHSPHLPSLQYHLPEILVELLS